MRAYDEQYTALDSRRRELEVKISEIAAATGLDRSTIRGYMNGSAKKPATQKKISRYLDSREFYRGYLFRPRDDFARLLDRVLSQLSISGVTATDVGAAVGISQKRISLLRTPAFGEITPDARADVYEQHRILMTAHEICCDSTGDTARKLEELSDELEIVLALDYPPQFRQEFARIVDVSLDGISDELPELKKYDLDELRHNECYIKDMDERYAVLKALFDHYYKNDLMFPDELMETMFTAGYYRIPRAKYADIISQSDRTDVLSGCPPLLRQIVCAYPNAFIDGKHDEVFKDSGVEDSSLFKRKKELHGSFSALDREKKVEMLDFLSDKFPITLIYNINDDYFESNLQLSQADRALSSDFSSMSNRYFNKISDLSRLIILTSAEGSLDRLLKRAVRAKERTAALGISADASRLLRYDDALEQIEYKLGFDVTDWYFWTLITAAVGNGVGLSELKEMLFPAKTERPS